MCGGRCQTIDALRHLIVIVRIEIRLQVLQMIHDIGRMSA